MNPLERRLWVADGLTHSADGLGPDTPDTSSAIQTRCINSVALQALPSGPPGVRWKRIGHPHGQDPPVRAALSIAVSARTAPSPTD